MGELTVKVRTGRHGGGDISSRMTFQAARVRKPLLPVSGVIDKGNILVFDGSGSFTLPKSCAGVASVRKAITGVQGRIPLHAKMKYLSCGRGNLRTRPRRVSVGGEPLERPSTRLPVRPLKEKELGSFGEWSISNPGSEPGVVALKVAPNVSARGADDVDMGDEVAQRGASDAESIGGDEV